MDSNLCESHYKIIRENLQEKKGGMIQMTVQDMIEAKFSAKLSGNQNVTFSSSFTKNHYVVLEYFYPSVSGICQRQPTNSRRKGP